MHGVSSASAQAATMPRRVAALDVRAYVSPLQLQRTQALVDTLVHTSSTTVAAAANATQDTRAATTTTTTTTTYGEHVTSGACTLRRALDAVDLACQARAQSATLARTTAAASTTTSAAATTTPLCVRAVLQRRYGVVDGARLYRGCVHEPRAQLHATVTALTRATVALFVPQCATTSSTTTRHVRAADYDIHVQLLPSSAAATRRRASNKTTPAAAATALGVHASLCAAVFVRLRSALRLRAAQQAALVRQYMRVAAPRQTLQSALQFWASVSYRNDIQQQQQQRQQQQQQSQSQQQGQEHDDVLSALPPLGLSSAAQLADVDEQSLSASLSRMAAQASSSASLLLLPLPHEQQQQGELQDDAKSDDGSSSDNDDNSSGGTTRLRTRPRAEVRARARKRARHADAAYSNATAADTANNDNGDDNDDDATTTTVLGWRDDAYDDDNDDNNKGACEFCQPSVLIASGSTVAAAAAAASTTTTAAVAPSRSATARMRHGKCGLVGVLYITTQATAYVAYPSVVTASDVTATTTATAVVTGNDDSNGKTSATTDDEAARRARARVWHMPLDTASSFTRGLLGLS